MTKESILIRRAEGERVTAPLPKTGALSAEKIGPRFHLADEVQITCKPKDPDHCAELRSIRFLRPPTPREQFLILGSPAPASPPDAELERVRQVNLDRAKHMPSFIADETAKRYTSPRSADPPVWRLVDIVEADIVFQGKDPIHEHIRINGKPWTKPQIPGVNWSAEFGTEIKPVFDPECPTEIASAGREEARGRQLPAYVFTSPPDGCFGWATWNSKRYNAAVTGGVIVENSGGGLIQYEEKADRYPRGFGVQQFRQTIVWDDVKIGDVSYQLPVTIDFDVGFTTGDPWHVSVEYKNHRRFEAATSITFK